MQHKKLVIRRPIVVTIFGAVHLTTGCVMDGVKYVTVLDEHSEPIKRILVIPLYSSSAGIGFGADNAGFSSKAQVQVKKPFYFDSGEDLMAKQLHSRCCLIPLPFPPWCIGIWCGDEAFAWLFIKKQQGIVALGRNNLYGNNPIFMTNSAPSEVSQTIELLLDPRGDHQAVMRRFYVRGVQEIEDVQVTLDVADRELLEALR